MTQTCLETWHQKRQKSTLKPTYRPYWIFNLYNARSSNFVPKTDLPVLAMRCFPCRLVQLSRCNHITIFWGKGLTAMILDGFLRVVPSPNPLFLLFILVLWLYFCVLDSFSLRVSLKWGVGPMALDGSPLHNSQKVRRSISPSGHGATLFCRLRGPTCMLSGAAFGLSSCVTFCQVMEMIRMILCIDGMMKPSWHDIYNITDAWKISVSMYNCNIKSGSISTSSCAGPTLLAFGDFRSLRSAQVAALGLYAWGALTGRFGEFPHVWPVRWCLVFGILYFYDESIITWNSNTFVVILVCAMNLHCGNHDLMIVAISNMILTGMMKNVGRIGGHWSILHKKTPLFRSNCLNRSWWRVKLLICCGDVARCALGKPTTVMVGIIFWGKWCFGFWFVSK